MVVELLVNIVDGTRLVRLVPQGLLEKLKRYKGKVAGFVVILCAKASNITNVFSSYKSLREDTLLELPLSSHFANFGGRK